MEYLHIQEIAFIHFLQEAFEVSFDFNFIFLTQSVICPGKPVKGSPAVLVLFFFLSQLANLGPLKVFNTFTKNINRKQILRITATKQLLVSKF